MFIMLTHPLTNFCVYLNVHEINCYFFPVIEQFFYCLKSLWFQYKHIHTYKSLNWFYRLQKIVEIDGENSTLISFFYRLIFLSEN